MRVPEELYQTVVMAIEGQTDELTRDLDGWSQRLSQVNTVSRQRASAAAALEQSEVQTAKRSVLVVNVVDVVLAIVFLLVTIFISPSFGAAMFIICSLFSPIFLSSSTGGKAVCVFFASIGILYDWALTISTTPSLTAYYVPLLFLAILVYALFCWTFHYAHKGSRKVSDTSVKMAMQRREIEAGAQIERNVAQQEVKKRENALRELARVIVLWKEGTPTAIESAAQILTSNSLLDAAKIIRNYQIR